MDSSRDVIESAKPPKQPRPGASHEVEERERGTSPLMWTVAVCAVAAAVFTGITAWETHQDRVNTETIYCGFYAGAQTDENGDERSLTDYEQRLVDQLGCG